MEEQTKGLNDYIVSLRRRKKPVLLTVGLVMLISVAAALLLPPVYRSTAKILIEEQEVPPELVRSTITGYADQRIQVISQQIMTRATLIQIIEKYNLYPSKRRKQPGEGILERLRKDIKLDIVTADVIDRRSGSKTSATIGFTLSYDGETAESAQKVANELVSLYLNENLKNRKQKTAETSTFLSEEAARLGEHIAEIEAKLAAFKAKNLNRLPELVQLNTQLRDRIELEIRDVDRQISALEERKFYLDGQLAQIKPNSPMISASGERIYDADERLKALQAQFASLSGVYSARHPDVVKMRREIEALQKETGSGADPQEHEKKLTRLRADLATLRDKYSHDHPDVIKLKRSIAALEEQRPALSDGPEMRQKKAENPAYITLQAQLQAVNSEVKALRSKRNGLKSKFASYESWLVQTPQVEREYLDLNRDHENSVRRYHEIKAKQMEAQVAQELEADRKAERFSVIDPPKLPEKPRSPNRRAILLLGLFLSVGSGVACAGVLEALDGSVRGSKAFAGILKAPLLGEIPYIENNSERLEKRKIRRIAAASLISGAVLTILLAHFFWTPLDVLWFMLLRRLEI
jgi:succinoglycan biosynthesis transport protein ExoP